jgi:hypothetical protein
MCSAKFAGLCETMERPSSFSAIALLRGKGILLGLVRHDPM